MKHKAAAVGQRFLGALVAGMGGKLPLRLPTFALILVSMGRAPVDDSRHVRGDMIRRIFEAVYLGRASQAASRGNVAKALSLVNRIKVPTYNRGTTEALRADMSLVSGEREAAVRSIQLCREYVRQDGKSEEFLLRYCEYLEAVMRGDVDEVNRLSDALSSLPKCLAKDMLNIVKPVTRQELAALRVDRVVSHSVH